jgi:outer membrane lipase/esterase
MSKRRHFGRVLAGAAIAVIGFCGTPAAAQQVDRIVAFGDSYADDGNAFQLLGIDPVTTIIYPTGRFTGGTNYVDTLGTIYSVTPENFAIGGALTDNNNTTPPLPGFTYEWSTFLTGGGGVFPTVSGTFSPGDLVTVSIGGNDARVYTSGGGTVAGAPAAASVAVTNATAGLNALVNAGAPTISFLAGNTALLPEVAGDPSAQAVRAAYSTAFNQGMQTTLAGYAANGTIVDYLDLTLLLQNVQADPSAYGFTSVGPCAPIAQCVADSTYANQFVFWVDGLHPTSRTSALFAQYIATQLQAPLTLEAPSELGLDTARQFARTLTGRMDLSSPRDGDLAKGLQVFLVGDYLSRDVAPDLATDAFEIRGYGVTAGAQYGFGNGVVGIAGNYSRPKASFTNDASETRDRTWQIGGYGAADLLGGFGQAYVGYGHDDHRIARTGIVLPINASPSGSHWVAGAKAGYLASLGLLRVGPVVALDYAKAKVGGYSESGDPALTLNVGSSSAKALEGSIGAELRGRVEAGGAGIRPFGSVVLVKDLIGDGRTIEFAQTSAPTIVNSWQFADRSKHVYERVSAGASARLFGGVNVDALISTTFDKRDGNDTAAHVGVRVDF